MPPACTRVHHARFTSSATHAVGLDLKAGTMITGRSVRVHLVAGAKGAYFFFLVAFFLVAFFFGAAFFLVAFFLVAAQAGKRFN